MKKFLTAMCGLVLLAACSKSEPVKLNGKEFMLLDTPSNAYVTISFDETGTKIAGQAPINRYMGGYQSDGENITFSSMGVTMMAGPQELMDAENTFLQALTRVQSFKLEGRKLILTTNSGENLVFEEVEPQAPMTENEEAPSADVLTGEAEETTEAEVEMVPAQEQAPTPAQPAE